MSGGRLVWTPHRLQAPSELRTARGGSLVPSPHFRAWTILQQAGFLRCSNPLVEALQLEGSHPPAFPFLHCATGTRHTVPADGEEKRERGAIFIGLDCRQGHRFRAPVRKRGCPAGTGTGLGPAQAVLSAAPASAIRPVSEKPCHPQATLPPEKGPHCVYDSQTVEQSFVALRDALPGFGLSIP